ncbi:MAG: Fe-S cluster assembly protein SufD [Anaerolineae bacterium]|nr:Fe-S cluster assembly protein SufD [Anaerolineae bacterium]
MGGQTSIENIELPLTQDNVAALSQQLEEPGWLREKRLEAWRIAETLPMPTLTDEAWRRTDIRGLRWDETMHFPDSDASGSRGVPAELTTPLIGERQGGLLVYLDGRLIHGELADEPAQKGVIFGDLREVSASHPDLVRRFFDDKTIRPGEDKLAAMALALWTHGVFLYVPRHVEVELPFHSIEYVSGSAMTATHIMVLLEEGAKATYLHECASPTLDVQTLHLGSTELVVGDNADLQYIALQNWGEHVYNFGHQRARVGRDARVDWVAGEMGTRLCKVFQTLDLDGDGAWGRLSGLYFAHDHQHLDLDTQQNHRALHTTSDLLFKGALKGHSRTVWQGMIVAEPGARKTDGFQANRNLILDNAARADSIPGLEIKANDLRCTHAATVGRVDDTELFYLMSRGIPHNDAVKVIVDGFFDPLMQRIPFEGVRERLQMSIDSKMEVG